MDLSDLLRYALSTNAAMLDPAYTAKGKSQAKKNPGQARVFSIRGVKPERLEYSKLVYLWVLSSRRKKPFGSL